MNLRISGQGAEGDPGAPKGNLLLHVIVAEDDYFVRDGYDVHTEVPISLTQAVLGEELLREFDAETHKCGSGISGKLADAVGSAFANIFGGSKQEDKTKDNREEDVEEPKKEAV
ncbi:DnaJ C terminal domain-containing protein [Fragilaria crotonensis]|nr:DnaJ C terminal domain-containing protein [Fragilaria crotonensis]